MPIAAWLLCLDRCSVLTREPRSEDYQFLCSKSLLNRILLKKEDLNIHIESVRERKKHLNVMFVKQFFFQKTNLRVHIESVHEQKKQFKCKLL